MRRMQTRLELEQENAHIRAQLLAKEALLESKATLLEQQVYQLKNQDSLLKKNETRLASQTRLIEQLKEALILARNRQFAKRTESLRSMQGELFDEVETLVNVPTDDNDAEQAPPTTSVSGYSRKKGARKPLPEDLPRIDVIHDLADEEKVCAKGHELVFMSDKVSEQLDIIPMQMRVLRHIRKHRCMDATY